MLDQSFSENDPRYHTQDIGGMRQEWINRLREDVDKVHDPQARALFETSAEVIQGLQRAFEQFEIRTEKVLR